MRAVIKNVGEAPHVVDVKGDLNSIKAVVDGSPRPQLRQGIARAGGYQGLTARPGGPSSNGPPGRLVTQN